jgi:glycine cleavage system aminomethyltransferase T
MIDFDKEKFSGSEAIFNRRKEGLTHKIIGVRAAFDDAAFVAGATIYHGNTPVATITTVSFSPILNCKLGLALFSQECAYSGLCFILGSGSEVKTISMPPIMPKSLTVKLDDMA